LNAVFPLYKLFPLCTLSQGGIQAWSYGVQLHLFVLRSKMWSHKSSPLWRRWLASLL